jgi:NADPH-dependent 2,4-dienoyl-CoA reductase/sulfur reductase-like enzyme
MRPWRSIFLIIIILHVSDIYAFPRVSILPGHEQKVFVPNTTIFTGDTMTGEAGKNPSPERHMWIHGSVNTVGKSSVRYTPFISKQEQSVHPIDEKPKTKDEVLEEGEEQEISFDYLIYALGAKYPSPINIHVPHPLPFLSSLSISGPSQTVLGEKTHELNPTPKGVHTGVGIVETSSSMGTKPEGVKWMQESQERIKRARKILVVGGGALGVRKSYYLITAVIEVPALNSPDPEVEMATDIQATHGSSKKITLLHSRSHLLNRFDPWMHEESLSKMREMGIEVILGERVDMGYVNHQEEGKVRCVGGRELEADLIVSV